jgi:hypothetical protein
LITEHGAAGITLQLVARGPGQHLAHHGVHAEYLAQPALGDGAIAELERRVVAEHVTHLHRELPAPGLVHDALEVREGLARRLVEMDVHARRDAAFRRVQQVAHLRLHGHGLQALRVQQLFLAEPRKAGEGLVALRGGAASCIGLNDAHDFEQVRQVADGGQLPRGVRVCRADLPDAEARRPGLSEQCRRSQCQHRSRKSRFGNECTSFHGKGDD